MCETRNHNIQLLPELGFDQYRNTTVFSNQTISIISPAVAQNTNGGYWFDLRKVNLDRLNPNSYLLVRIVPDLFIFETIENISKFITSKLMENRPNSGNVWALGLKPAPNEKTALLFNKANSDNSILVKLLNIEQARHCLSLLK